MNKVWTYLFRANLYDDDFTIYRDIVILSNQSLHDLLNFIRSLYGLDSIHDAIGAHCNGEWFRLQPIDLSKNPLLVDFVVEPNQKFYYCYDLEKEFEFFVELLDIREGVVEAAYPICVKEEGIAPAQYTPFELERAKDITDKNRIIGIKSALRWVK